MVVEARAEVALEGGDVVVLPGARGCFLGHGFRSSPRAARELERFLDDDVTCLELVDPRLYHLDMVLSVLDDGTALVCRQALTPASFAALARHPALTNLIEVPLDEALRFGVNLVQVGRSIVSGAAAPTVFGALRGAGYRIVHVELDQFHLAGGSAACLVSRVHAQAQDASNDNVVPQSTAA